MKLRQLLLVRVVMVLALILISQPLLVAEPLAKITVEAGKHLRIDTPVSASLDGITDDLSDTSLRLEEIKNSHRLLVPSQIEPDNPPKLWWILSDTTLPRTKRTYELLKQTHAEDPAFDKALENGKLANEGFVRCQNYVKAWLSHADPNTGLIPKGLRGDRKDIWNAQDAAADNYPFMVLTAAITDRPLFEGRMLDMLRTETRLTSRIGALPDTYSFSKQTFVTAEPDLGRIIFGSSEYIKDGLLPLTEWLGPAPWAEYTEKRVHPQDGYGRPGWLRISDYCCGMITGWGSHHIDIAQWAMGTEYTGPVEVEGWAEYPKEGLWDFHGKFRIEYTYADGVKLICEDNTKNKQGILFEGTESWVYVRRRLIDAQPTSLLTSVIRPNEIHLARSNNHKQNFLECIKSRSQTVAPVEIGHRSNTVCVLGYIAMLLGRKLKWDPGKERFINDTEANRLLSRPMRSPWNL